MDEDDHSQSQESTRPHHPHRLRLVDPHPGIRRRYRSGDDTAPHRQILSLILDGTKGYG